MNDNELLHGRGLRMLMHRNLNELANTHVFVAI